LPLSAYPECRVGKPPIANAIDNILDDYFEQRPLDAEIVSLDSVSTMVMIGSHTTIFYPDVSNGFGKNIRQPARAVRSS